MARKPNYNFERRERERVKAAKKLARQDAKRERTEKRKAEAAGLPLPGEDGAAEAGVATDEAGEATDETTDSPENGPDPMAQPENNQE
ncbi:MAG: hypothetical protein HOO19_20500 [Rhodospirillaceae bacterium]|jgi:hypothetical protein|nr:hypothetical protein [Rhodospirillaceae bacterium]MBT3887533.1 hypothetical protein [Rhodospirillaceae bacterium]MBT4115326.1 hypothetical protein [Rhodospirillaceae bacterium]MBT4674208.1 hypothetical protein [Rhodospirillaceae bacterium]MBT4718320.1 hypothetical protein [Rhodospirillaceae bacterium]